MIRFVTRCSGSSVRQLIRSPASPNGPNQYHRLIRGSSGLIQGDVWSLKRLIRPAMFTVGVGAVSFTSTAIWLYENYRHKVSSATISFWNSIVETLPSSSPDHKGIKRGQEWIKRIQDEWNKLTDGQRVTMVITALNLMVFIGWRIPLLSPFMSRYFVCNPMGHALCLPMLLSVFSHFSLLHLVVNMFVLNSFAAPTVNYFGKEVWISLYLTSGVLGSFFSLANKMVTQKAVGSVGASGAILGIVAAFCLLDPESKLYIVFLPFLTFPAGLALKGLMAVDTVGIFLRWSFLDHAAHLGGAVTGMAYMTYGKDWYPQYAQIVAQKYAHFRYNK